MRTFLNSIASDKNPDADMTSKADFNTEELLGKIDQVNEASKILRFPDPQNS